MTWMPNHNIFKNGLPENPEVASFYANSGSTLDLISKEIP
jgi:hypothetical protein